MVLNFSIDKNTFWYSIEELDQNYNRDDRAYWFEFMVYEKPSIKIKNQILAGLSTITYYWYIENKTEQDEERYTTALQQWKENTKNILTEYGQEQTIAYLLEGIDEPKHSDDELIEYICNHWGDFFVLSALGKVATFSERNPSINLIEQRDKNIIHSLTKEISRFPAKGMAEISLNTPNLIDLGNYVQRYKYFFIGIQLNIVSSKERIPDFILSCYQRKSQKKEKFLNYITKNQEETYFYNLGGENHNEPKKGFLIDYINTNTLDKTCTKIAEEWSAYFNQVLREENIQELKQDVIKQAKVLEKIRTATFYSFETKTYLDSYGSCVNINNFLNNTNLFIQNKVKEGVEISHYFYNEIKNNITNFPLKHTLNTYIDDKRGLDGVFSYETNGRIPTTEKEEEENENIPFVPSKAEIIVQNVTFTNVMDYDNFFEGVGIVTPTVSTSYKALFPPILESSQPAFLATTQDYEIYFQLSDYTNFEEVAHIDLKITLCSNGKSVVNETVWYDQIIYFPKHLIKKHEDNWYSVIINKNRDLQNPHWQNETYYKVQARLGTSIDPMAWESSASYILWRDQSAKKGYFSDWSTAMVLKAIPQPSLFFKNASKSVKPFFLPEQNNVVILNSSPLLQCEYRTNNLDLNFKGTEYLYKYRFFLYILNQETGHKEQIDSTNWIIYTNAIENENLSSFQYRFSTALQENVIYIAEVEVTTINNYVLTADFSFQIEVFDDTGLNDYCNLFYTYDEENGAVILKIQEKKPNQTYSSGLIIIRQELLSTCVDENNQIIDTYGPEQELKYVWLELQSGITEQIVYIDKTVECGKTYRYIAREQYIDGTRSFSVPFVCEEEPLQSKITTNFEHIFVYDGEKQLKLKFNPKVGDFKHITLAQKQDTLGGKFPIITKSGQTYYAEFSFGGLLTFYDEDGYFYNKNIFPYHVIEQTNPYRLIKIDSKTGKEIDGKQIITSNISNNFSDKIKIPLFSTNLTEDTINYERRFREDVEYFLNNDNYKLFRSPYEGNLIVALTETSLTGESKLGRAIATINTKATEMADYNYNNLIKYNIITPGEYQNYSSNSLYDCGQLEDNFLYNDNIINILNTKIKNENIDNKNNFNSYIQKEVLNYSTITISNYPYVPELLKLRILEEQAKDNKNYETISKLQNIYNLILEDYYCQSPIYCKHNNNSIIILPGQSYVFKNISPQDNLIIYNLNQNNKRLTTAQPLLIDYHFEYRNKTEINFNAIIGSWTYNTFGNFNGIFYNLLPDEYNYIFPNINNKQIIDIGSQNKFYRTHNINRLILEEIYNLLNEEFLLVSNNQINFSMQILKDANNKEYIEIIEHSDPVRKYEIILPEVMKISFEGDNTTIRNLSNTLSNDWNNEELFNPGILEKDWGFINSIEYNEFNNISKLFIDFSKEETPNIITKLQTKMPEYTNTIPCQMSIIYLAKILVIQRMVD